MDACNMLCQLLNSYAFFKTPAQMPLLQKYIPDYTRWTVPTVSY